MVIRLEDIGKRYGFDWIFKGVNIQFESGKSYALTGPNGSGKSTLLKVISGGLTPSKGKVHFVIPSVRNPDASQIARSIAFAAPYISLIDDLTLQEMIEFHLKFQTMQVNSADELLELSGLKVHSKKIIAQFSSGMMQRLKLSLSILSDTPVLLLDEPTSNLDAQGCAWYLDLMQQFTKNRLVVIGSNQPEEYTFVEQSFHVPDYKVRK